MSPNNGEPRLRNAQGLMLEQSLVLQELTSHSDWKKACDAVGVNYDRFRKWLRGDASFKAAFNTQFEKQADMVRQQIELSAQKAGEIYDSALSATRDLDIEVECTNCHTRLKITAEVPDWATRLKAGEVVLKVGKILKDVKEVQGKITIEQLDLPLRLALAAHNQGRVIPPGYYNQLVAEGFIIPPQLSSGETEGEYREVDTADE